MATGRKLISDVVENGKYFLYRHIREDKNQPFYIGIGTKFKKLKGFRSHKSEYHRAHYNHSTNIYQRIKNKSSIKIQILIESDNYQFIKEKEKEFIDLYGRIIDNTGTLCNLTHGGDGCYGMVVSEDTKRKISENNWTRGKFGKKNHLSKKIHQYSLSGEFIKTWESLADVGREFNPITKRIPSFRGLTFKGYQWLYDYMGEKISPVDYSTGIKRRVGVINVPVNQYDLNNNLINSYKSYTEASISTGISISAIHRASNSNNNLAMGFYWNKKEDDEHR